MYLSLLLEKWFLTALIVDCWLTVLLVQDPAVLWVCESSIFLPWTCHFLVSSRGSTNHHLLNFSFTTLLSHFPDRLSARLELEWYIAFTLTNWNLEVRKEQMASDQVDILKYHIQFTLHPGTSYSLWTEYMQPKINYQSAQYKIINFKVFWCFGLFVCFAFFWYLSCTVLRCKLCRWQYRSTMSKAEWIPLNTLWHVQSIMELF